MEVGTSGLTLNHQGPSPRRWLSPQNSGFCGDAGQTRHRRRMHRGPGLGEAGPSTAPHQECDAGSGNRLGQRVPRACGPPRSLMDVYTGLCRWLSRTLIMRPKACKKLWPLRSSSCIMIYHSNSIEQAVHKPPGIGPGRRQSMPPASGCPHPRNGFPWFYGHTRPMLVLKRASAADAVPRPPPNTKRPAAPIVSVGTAGLWLVGPTGIEPMTFTV